MNNISRVLLLLYLTVVLLLFSSCASQSGGDARQKPDKQPEEPTTTTIVPVTTDTTKHFVIVKLGHVLTYSNQEVTISYSIQPGPNTKAGKLYDIKVQLSNQVVGSGMFRFQPPREITGQSIRLAGASASWFMNLITNTAGYKALARDLSEIQNEQASLSDKVDEMNYNMLLKGEIPDYEDMKDIKRQQAEINAKERAANRAIQDFPYSAQLPNELANKLGVVVLDTYALETTVTPSNSGTISPANGVFSDGTKVSLSLTPVFPYYPLRWIGADSNSTFPTTVTVRSDKNVTAILVKCAAGENKIVTGEVYKDARGKASPVVVIPIQMNRFDWLDGDISLSKNYAGASFRSFVRDPYGKTIRDFGTSERTNFTLAAPSTGTHTLVIQNSVIFWGGYSFTYRVWKAE